MKRKQRQINLIYQEQDGVITIEFILLFPILLMLLLMILQIALIVQAKFVVNYAAFCAVRSAIVMIPAEVRSEKTASAELHNQIRLNDPNSPKLEALHRAAALPLTAISPVWSPRLGLATGVTPDASLAAPLGRVALLFPGSVKEQNVSRQILERAHYAYSKNMTKVEVFTERKGQTTAGKIGDHDLVTVRVTFRYFLTVPFANRLFGRAFLGSWWRGSGYYISISEQYTLPLEGEPLFPPGQRQRFIKPENEVYP